MHRLLPAFPYRLQDHPPTRPSCTHLQVQAQLELLLAFALATRLGGLRLPRCLGLGGCALLASGGGRRHLRSAFGGQLLLVAGHHLVLQALARSLPSRQLSVALCTPPIKLCLQLCGLRRAGGLLPLHLSHHLLSIRHRRRPARLLGGGIHGGGLRRGAQLCLHQGLVGAAFLGGAAGQLRLAAPGGVGRRVEG